MPEPATSETAPPMIPVRGDSAPISSQAKYDEVALNAAVENRIVQYAIELKVRDVIGRHFKTLVLPIVTVVGILAGYAGLELKSQIHDLRNARAEMDRLLEDQKRHATLLLGIREQLQVLSGGQKDIEHRAALAALNLQNTTAAARDLAATTLRQDTRLSESGVTLAALGARASSVDEDNERNRESLHTLNATITTLTEKLRAAEDKAERLSKISDFHQRVLAANVVEIVTLQTGQLTAEVKLPRPDGGNYAVRFEAPGISKQFTLKYFVDGAEHKVAINGDVRGTPIVIGETNGAYSFTVDHLYASRPGKNFLSIRIRGTPVIIPS